MGLFRNVGRFIGGHEMDYEQRNRENQEAIAAAAYSKYLDNETVKAEAAELLKEKIALRERGAESGRSGDVLTKRKKKKTEATEGSTILTRSNTSESSILGS